MLKSIIAVVWLLVFAPWAQSNVIYTVTMDYAGGYHYRFNLEFADNQGIKTEHDLLNDLTHSSDFWGDPTSEYGGFYHRASKVQFSSLRFDPTQPLMLEFLDPSQSNSGWTWGGGGFDTYLITCSMSHQALHLCGWYNPFGGTYAAIDINASRVGVLVARVPEPASLLLVVPALLLLGRRPAGLRCGPRNTH